MIAQHHPIPWAYLDPGIRDTVAALVAHGFDPYDSGDGVSKPAAGRVFDFRHVLLRAAPDRLLPEARRLVALLPLLGCEGWTVDITYRFPEEAGTIALLEDAP